MHILKNTANASAHPEKHLLCHLSDKGTSSKTHGACGYVTRAQVDLPWEAHERGVEERDAGAGGLHAHRPGRHVGLQEGVADHLRVRRESSVASRWSPRVSGGSENHVRTDLGRRAQSYSLDVQRAQRMQAVLK